MYESYFYLTLTLFWAPAPEVAIEAGPIIYIEDEHTACDVLPLTLTWSPAEGFGAQSQVTYVR